MFGNLDSLLNSNNLSLSDGSEIPMGLILAKEIVQQYRGQLDFSSEYTVGSTFVFTFGVDIPDDQQMESLPDIFSGESPRFAFEPKQQQSILESIVPQRKNYEGHQDIDINLQDIEEEKIGDPEEISLG